MVLCSATVKSEMQPFSRFDGDAANRKVMRLVSYLTSFSDCLSFETCYRRGLYAFAALAIEAYVLPSDANAV
jgi:hypothetical protein